MRATCNGPAPRSSGSVTPMHKDIAQKQLQEIVEINDSGCKCCGSLDSSEMQVSVNNEDKMGIVCDECGEAYVYPDSPGKHATDGYDYADDRDYSLFAGKPTNRDFKKFRNGKEKRRDKENKPIRGGIRDVYEFADD